MSGGLYAQRISSAGEPLWTADGVPVCTAPGGHSEQRILPDGSGGAFIVWREVRISGGGIFAQRLSAQGEALWAVDGIPLGATTNTQLRPRIVSDGADGAIVAWTNYATGALCAQRMDGSGHLLWAPDGIAMCSAPGDQYLDSLVPDGAGGAIAVWNDFRVPGTIDVYAQRVSASGALLWPPEGIRLCDVQPGRRDAVATADNSGGAIVAWPESRGFSQDIYAQRIRANGSRPWGTDGIPLCQAAETQDRLVITADGSGGAIVAWEDHRNQTGIDVYAQRILATGSVVWQTNGVPVSVVPGLQEWLAIDSDEAGGAIIAWQDLRNGVDVDIYAQRVDASGELRWTLNGLPVSLAVGAQKIPSVVSDTRGGAIIAWADGRTGIDYDIYAQRVEHQGKLGSPEPMALGVRDVTGDQGGRVKVSWAASYLDAEPTFGILDYRVWRSVPAATVASRPLPTQAITDSPEIASKNGGLLALPFSTQGYLWELVGQQPAAQLPGYSMIVATTRDSLPGSNPFTAFLVEARQGDQPGSERWFSLPDSGYSVDNLAPASPVDLSATYAAGSVRLVWAKGNESDLVGYAIYRSGVADFEPSEATAVGATPGNEFVHATNSSGYYKVVARDAHGNSSLPASVYASGLVDAPQPTTLRLALDVQNPTSRGLLSVTFTLPSQAPAVLEVTDLQGRCMRSANVGSFGKGTHTLRLGESADMPPGVYFLRLSQGENRKTRRVIVLE